MVIFAVVLKHLCSSSSGFCQKVYAEPTVCSDLATCEALDPVMKCATFTAEGRMKVLKDGVEGVCMKNFDDGAKSCGLAVGRSCPRSSQYCDNYETRGTCQLLPRDGGNCFHRPFIIFRILPFSRVLR